MKSRAVQHPLPSGQSQESVQPVEKQLFWYAAQWSFLISPSLREHKHTDQEFEVEDDFKVKREPNAHHHSGEIEAAFFLSPQSALIFKKSLSGCF